MACIRMFFAIEEVAKKQQEKQEESAAAAKIQARYRGKKAGKDMRLHLRVLLLLFPCRFWVLHGVPQFNVIKLMPQPPSITPGKFGDAYLRCSSSYKIIRCYKWICNHRMHRNSLGCIPTYGFKNPMGIVPGGSRDAGAERGRHGDPSEVPTKSGAARNGRTAKGETGTDGADGSGPW